MFQGINTRCVVAAALSALSALGSGCSDDASEPVTDAALSHDAASTDAGARDGAASNLCPVVSSTTVVPTVTTVGDTVAISVTVSDPDNGPLPLSWSWQATVGGVGIYTSVKSPEYKCTQAGTPSITYTITDGTCTVGGTLSVTCIDPSSDGGVVGGADGGFDSGAEVGSDAGAGGGDAGVSPKVVINEVESMGGTDWVELLNAGTLPVDVSGWVFKDNDDSHTFVIPSGTMIAPGGYLVLEPEPSFGLGPTDAARLYNAGGVTLVDSYSWTVAAASTYGRCPNGTGPFKETLTSKGVANNCLNTDDAGVPWPGPSTVAEVDAPNAFPGNLSGLAYQAGDVPANSILWAVRNDPGTLYRLQTDGTLWTSPSSGEWTTGKRMFYPSGIGNPDSEGIAVVPGAASPLVYVATERDGPGTSRLSILQMDPSVSDATLTAQHEWNLTADLPTVGANLGLEGIAFVSDSELSEQAFHESDGQPYNQARFADHGGGVFLVGVEGTGNIHVYALNHADDSFLRLATFSSGMPAVMDLDYDPDTNYLWAYGDNTVGNLAVLFEIEPNMASLTYGQFVQRRVFQRPSGLPNLNNEGIAFAPESECDAGVRAFFWSDDTPTTGHALRRGGIPCGRAY